MADWMAYLESEFAKNGLGRYRKIQIVMVTWTLCESQHAQIHYFNLRRIVRAINGGSASMVRIWSNRAPAFV